MSGRTQTDSKRFPDAVDGKNVEKFEWKTFDPTDGLHLKITGCNNENYYIAKDDKQNDVIIQAFTGSSTNMKILSQIDLKHVACWKLVEKGEKFPSRPFRVYTGSMYICIGKHSEKGVGRVELDEDNQWQFVPANGTNKESYDYEVLCQ